MGEDNGNNKNEIVLVKPLKKDDYRDKEGKFVKGKAPGRPPGTRNYLTLIEESLEKQAKLAGVTFWDKLAEWAMTNPISGYALLRKFVPDKEKIEHSGIEPIQITIKRANAEPNS